MHFDIKIMFLQQLNKLHGGGRNFKRLNKFPCIMGLSLKWALATGKVQHQPCAHSTYTI